MKYAFIDVCNTLAMINEAIKTRGYDPGGHTLSPDLPLWLDESLYYHAAVHKPSMEVVRELEQEGYRILYLTARPLPMIPVTETWLKIHNAPPAQVLCSAGMRKGQFLTEFVKSLPMEEMVLMDDAPKEIESFYEFAGKATIKTQLIIPRHNYNAHYKCDREILLYNAIG
jgi:hypothetical protein